jgi:hypothetical protein
MTGEERLQAIADLSSPERIGSAIVRLFEDASGVSVAELTREQFGEMVAAWVANNPEFPNTPTNHRLLLLTAKSYAGTWPAITPQHLDKAFADLERDGTLVAETPAQGALPNGNNEPSQSSPAETPLPTPARPRTIQATGYRSMRTATGSGAPPFKPKYTREQIDGMSVGESEKLIRSNDVDYERSLAFWYPSKRA